MLLIIYQPTSGSVDMNNETPGVAYSTEFTITDNGTYTYNDYGGTIEAAGPGTRLITPRGSVWKVDRKMQRYGEMYYRIGKNEWVDRLSGTEKPASSNIVTTKNMATLYTESGVKITNRALAPNTPWYTDRSATINGQKMYRVATNEWVSAIDIK